MDFPCVRPVEAFPIQYQGRTAICLRDPMGYAPQPLILGLGAYFLVSLMDGSSSVQDLAEAYANRFAQALPPEQIADLINSLEQGFFLRGSRFDQRVAAAQAEFAALPARAAAHAGLCYSSEPSALRAELAAFFDPPGGPGRAPGTVAGSPPAGLIVPHIDPRRGGVAYAHGYYQLMRRRPPDLFVILGTSHYGAGPQLFTATMKDYATPLGNVTTDREFIRRLAARYREGDLLADELLHRNEHSIEFQALFLAATLGILGYTVVPILVSSFHPMVLAGTSPGSDPRVASFLDALRSELAADGRRVCIIAGVDFAHVGRKFGDERAADEAFISWVRDEDHALIATIERGDPEAFFAAISKDGDRRRICGLAPMYTQLALLRAQPGRLLAYDVALEAATESAVSFASLVID